MRDEHGYKQMSDDWKSPNYHGFESRKEKMMQQLKLNIEDVENVVESRVIFLRSTLETKE